MCAGCLKYMPDIFENLFKKVDAGMMMQMLLKIGALTLQDRTNSFSGLEFCLCSDLHELDNMHSSGIQSDPGEVLSKFLSFPLLALCSFFVLPGSVKLSTFTATLGFDIFPREE